jgi:bifunctional DNase/RNase
MSNLNVIQVDIYGLSLTSSIGGGGYAIILKEIEGKRRIPIIIGQFEAQAIAFELEGVKPPRPLTHDLLRNIIETLGYNVESIIINELKDSTFYAKIRLDSDDMEDIDARPSDAIAIALKFSAPIYISSSIIDEVGFIPESDGKSETDTDLKEEGNIVKESEKTSSKEDKIKRLKKELEEAVQNEDYERATILRDEIKKLEMTNLNN